MAEEEGFEPSESCPSAVFKTAALNHSTILPQVILIKITPEILFYKWKMKFFSKIVAVKRGKFFIFA